MFHILRTLTLCALVLAMTATARGEAILTNDDKPLNAQAQTRQPESPRAIFRRSDRFEYVLRKAKDKDSPIFVLLHGSGGNENTLMELARKIVPDATFLGVRGRVEQDGISRWYRRLTPTSFDQKDIRAEAQAFAAFLAETASENSIDLKKAIFLGYSNGANLIGAVSLLHPNLVHKAVLLRAMPVLDQAPTADLKALDILTIAGKSDVLYSPFAPKLENLLRNCGANVEARMIESGHDIGEEDARLVRQWLMAEANPR